MLQNTENNRLSAPRTAMHSVLQNINYLGEILSYLDFTDLLRIDSVLPKHIKMSPWYARQLNRVWEQLFHAYFPDHQYYISDLRYQYKQVFKQCFLDFINLIVVNPELLLSISVERRCNIIKIANTIHDIKNIIQLYALQLYNNKELMLSLIKSKPGLIVYGTYELRVDRDIVRYLVESNLQNICFIPTAFQYFNEDIWPLIMQSKEFLLYIAAYRRFNFNNFERLIDPATNKVFLQLQLLQTVPPGICTVLAASALLKHDYILQDIMEYRKKLNLLPLPYCHNNHMWTDFKDHELDTLGDNSGVIWRYMLYQKNFEKHIWQYKALRVLRVLMGVIMLLLGIAMLFAGCALTYLSIFSFNRSFIFTVDRRSREFGVNIFMFGLEHIILRTDNDLIFNKILSQQRDEFKSAYFVPNYVEQQCELLIARLQCDKTPAAQAKAALLKQVYQKALQALPEHIDEQVVTVEQRQALLKTALAQNFDVDHQAVVHGQASFVSIAAASRGSRCSFFRAKQTTTTQHINKLLAYNPIRHMA